MSVSPCTKSAVFAEQETLAKEIYDLIQFSNLTFIEASQCLVMVQARMDDLKRVSIGR